jgi:hypothetical protein
LILNKDNILREKIRYVEMKYSFPAYKGGSDYIEGINSIKQQFDDLDSGSDVYKIKIQVIAAIDKDPMLKWLDQVLDPSS